GTSGFVQDALLRVQWTPLPDAPGDRDERGVVIIGSETHGLAGERHADLADLRRALERGAARPEIVVVPFVARCEGQDVVAAAHAATQRALARRQRWIGDETLSASMLVIVTRGAVATGAADTAVDLVHAGLWGLVRSVQNEHADLRIVLLDVDDTDAMRGALPSALGAADARESQLAVGDGQLLVPRLARLAPVSQVAAAAPRLDADGTVLITGGTGALGSLLAQHLVQAHGAKHLLLTSRRGLAAPGAEALRNTLEAAGAQVAIAACAAADRAALETLLASIAPEHPLTAVVHAAGVVDDGVVTS